MSEYRSDLRAARDRIEQLEASAPPPLPRSPVFVTRRFLALLGIATLAYTTIGGVALRLSSPAHIVVDHPAPIPAPERDPLPTGLGWYEAGANRTHAGPWVAGDLLVGLAWDRTKTTNGLYAVALDRTTLRARWKRGPFPGVRAADATPLHHIVVVGYDAYVTHGEGVEILDVATGSSRKTIPLPRPAVQVCEVEEGRVLFAVDTRGVAPRHDPNVVFDRRTNALVRAAGATCTEATFCSKNVLDDCRLFESRDLAPHRAPSFVSESVWRTGDRRVAIGWVEGSLLAATGWSEHESKLAWEDDRIAQTAVWRRPTDRIAAIDKDTLVIAYHADTGEVHLAARGVTSGGHVFDVAVANTGEATELVSVTTSSRDLFVAIDDDLIAFDKANGLERARMVLP